MKEATHISGLTVEEFQSLSGLPRWQTDMVMRFLVERGRIQVEGEMVTLAGHKISLSGEVKKAHDDIMGRLRGDPYAPPVLATLSAGGKSYRDAIGYIIATQEGYKCGGEFVFLTSVWNEIVGFIRERLSSSGRLAVADLRDRFGFSRKFVIPILEETDRLGVTRRDGDIRVKGDDFGK